MSDKPTAVRVYLARVRTSLEDLPAGEVEEILDDVRPHLAELEAETGPGARVDDLIERLGTPESYAAELRASGDYPAVAEAGVTTAAKRVRVSGIVQPRIAFWGLVLSAAGAGVVAFLAGTTLDADVLLALALPAPVFLLSLMLLLRAGVERVAALPEAKWLAGTLDQARENANTARTMRFLATLKPAWWVACALVLVAFGLLLMARHRQAVLLLPLLIGVGVAAVWAGPRVHGDRRLLWMVVPVSAFVVGGLFGGFGATVDLIGNRTPYQAATSSYPTADSYGNQELRYGGTGVDNIYAFDAEGKPLTEVYLYDEKGQPITLTRYGCRIPKGGKEKIGEDNRFPRPGIETTEVARDRGTHTLYETVCRENKDVPFSAAIPKASAKPPTSVPSASASVPSASAPSSPSQMPSAPASAPVSTTPSK
ncbi:DUF1700 domain-containing protein [Kibdelosporangium phytohabitans]|uniref:Proline-rich protein n=1 Tax=Kibdelosporangium phytohabitans TaxID=860235 RepID=A0A0N9HW05_9PSEU|nr:hypothetical protein [Kibdelosporangium phytohabitans]ALG09418.1 hypothetical protein AOZ06_23150 [Kibdelosporangium phytohabitans]MBE1469301.1 putative membrane protein [Kibdelosporangium phytohabitans]